MPGALLELTVPDVKGKTETEAGRDTEEEGLDPASIACTRFHCLLLQGPCLFLPFGLAPVTELSQVQGDVLYSSHITDRVTVHFPL